MSQFFEKVYSNDIKVTYVGFIVVLCGDTAFKTFKSKFFDFKQYFCLKTDVSNAFQRQFFWKVGSQFQKTV